MKAFEQGETYDELEEFFEAVMETIDSMRVNINEYFPDALFFCDSQSQGYVVHAEDLVEDTETDDELVDDELIMKYHFPKFIKQNDVKWYIKTTLIQNESESEFMLINYGSLTGTGAYVAPIEVDENEDQFIREKIEVDCEGDMFSDFIVPTRRAITNQG